MTTFDEAIQDLYRIAIEDRKPTSPARMYRLADYCVEQLARLGLPGAEREALVPGIGREKNWDVAWRYEGKCRLAISLKSILKNLEGTVPNRIDDLMGEVANLQLYSPEIVIGYIMVFDVSHDGMSAKHGQKWVQLLRARLGVLSGRRPPAWSVGMIEDHAVVEVDFSKSCRVLSAETEVRDMLERLVQQVVERNPSLAMKEGEPDGRH
ncbi:MAG TPA: hypothetical protein GX513_13390 [Firmicutes bacterium]|nr:hypothetical protein [Bacillota bacterium]